MDHYAMKRLHDAAKQQNEQKYKENSKRRLMANIGKKFQTTMIGSLSKFEEEFGYFWGNDKDYSEKTKQEKELFDKWQNVRTAILNNGNNQSRAAMDEMNQYTISWNKFHTEFIVKRN